MGVRPACRTPITEGFKFALIQARKAKGLTQRQAGEALEERVGFLAEEGQKRRESMEKWVGYMERSSMVRIPELEMVGELLRLYGTTWREVLRVAGVPEELIG